MSILTGHEKWRLQHYRKYDQHPYNFLRADNSKNGPIKASILRRENSQEEPSTQMSNEIGTTDQAIGDVTVEEMLTTPGKIPNEMYDIENTIPGATSGLETIPPPIREQYSSNSKEIAVAQPSIFLIIGVIIGILLLFGCIITCAISRVKKKNYKKLNKKDVECCTVNRPLLSTCKRKDSSTSTCCKD